MSRDTPQARNARAISRIAVSGFKSIDEQQDIMVAPLTVLAGANSAGKSSIMQPLLLWKQTLEAPFDPEPLLLDGPCVRFTSAEQLLFKGRDAFLVEVETVDGIQIGMEYERPAQGRLGIKSMRFRRFSGGKLNVVSRESTDVELWEAVASGLDEHYADIRSQLVPNISTKRSFSFLELSSDDPGLVYHALMGARDERAMKPASALIPALQEAIHIPGLRGNPARSYRTSDVGRHFPGTFEPYVASLINDWQRNDEPRHRALVADLRSIGLTRNIKAERIDDTQVQLRVGRLPASERFGNTDLVNISDVGFGVSQVIPVITALHAADPGRLVYIEQPELHLHPRAQAALAGVLVSAANRGVRIFAETHSAILLRALQTAVVRGQISASDLSLNWFTRDMDTGATRVTRADLDEDGSFGDWPEDFDDVALDVEGAYLDAVEDRRAG